MIQNNYNIPQRCNYCGSHLLIRKDRLIKRSYWIESEISIICEICKGLIWGVIKPIEVT